MPFENSTRKPFIGNFSWYPTTLATGASVPTGFFSLGLENGKFRNDVVDKSVKVSYKGDLKSSKNSLDFPFVNAFRLLANPASFTKFATQNYLLLLMQLIIKKLLIIEIDLTHLLM